MGRFRFACKALLCIPAVFFALTSFAFADEVKVGAGAAPSQNIFTKIQQPMEKDIGLKLTLINNGPVEALKDLDGGKIDAAAGGLTFADWMSMMEKSGYPIADPSVYKSRVIGKDIVKVLANKDVGVKSLSKDQLKAIFTGKATNWKEVGGPDLAVKVVWGSKIPGTQNVFQKQVMDGVPYLKNVIESTTAPQIKETVSKTPGAVGLGPISIVDASVLVPSIQEVGRPITLVTRGAPSPNILKMLNYITGEGQKYVVK